jgi:hypothetical protein
MSLGLRTLFTHDISETWMSLAGFVLPWGGVPWFRLQLLQSERNPSGFRIDLQQLDLNFLSDGENVFGATDAAPGDVADVQQAVDAAEVNEGAVGGQAAHLPADHVAFLHRGVAVLLLGESLFFHDGAAIDDNVFVGGVEFDDAAGDFLPDQLFHLGGVAHTAAGSGHKRANAHVYAEAAFNNRSDGADDGDFLRKGSLQRGPIRRLAHFETGQFVIAFGVSPFYGDGKFVAGSDALRVIREGGARQDSFNFETNVENDRVCGNGDDGAFELL